MKKVGLFGGSFDPIHKAHVTIAKLALEQLQLDEIQFIPTKNNRTASEYILSSHPENVNECSSNFINVIKTLEFHKPASAPAAAFGIRFCVVPRRGCFFRFLFRPWR